MISIDELEILLNLNGNNRLVHLEKDIFNCPDVQVIYLYLTRIIDNCSCKSHVYEYLKSSSGHTIQSDTGACWAIFYISEHVLHGRWTEAECILIKDEWWYNTYNIKHGII